VEKYRNPHEQLKENLFFPLFNTNLISKFEINAGKDTRHFNPLEDHRLPETSCIFVLEVSNLPLSTIFRLDIGPVPTVCYYYFFHFVLSILMGKYRMPQVQQIKSVSPIIITEILLKVVLNTITITTCNLLDRKRNI
jgi:hypothetical protein